MLLSLNGIPAGRTEDTGRSRLLTPGADRTSGFLRAFKLLTVAAIAALAGADRASHCQLGGEKNYIMESFRVYEVRARSRGCQYENVED